MHNIKEIDGKSLYTDNQHFKESLQCVALKIFPLY